MRLGTLVSRSMSETLARRKNSLRQVSIVSSEYLIAPAYMAKHLIFKKGFCCVSFLAIQKFSKPKHFDGGFKVAQS